MANVRIKFVSKKVSKVKWKPESNSVFVTGSWDDVRNHICLWNYPTGLASLKDSSDSLDNADPQIVAEVYFPGDVTDLKVTSSDLLFASSSRGSLHMYKLGDQKLTPFHTWENIHTFVTGFAASTAISVKGSEFVSVGEDGCICLFNFIKLTKTRKIESSDQCSFSAVGHLRHQEIVAGNVLGCLKAFDLRVASDQPQHTLINSGDQVGVTSINAHPTQPHVFATGHEDGSLYIWDLRQERRPTTILAGHTSSVMDILFHPTNPDFLYTCSDDGTIWQWDASALKSGSVGNTDQEQTVASGNPWLNCDAGKHRLDITSLFPHNTVCINSLDITDSTLLWGSDNEALYILPDVIV